MIKRAIGTLVLGSIFASGMAAALPIDQQQPNVPTLQTGVNNLSAKIQGFTPAQNNIAGGGFYFGRLYTRPVSLTISVWSGLPGSGFQFASGDATLSTLGWLDAFWSPVAVTPGEMYYLELFTNDIPASSDEPAVNSDLDLPGPSYAGGAAYSWNRNTGVFENSGNPSVTFDLGFRTFYDDKSVPEVPEPGSLALLGLGLAGLGLYRRRAAR